MTSKCVRTKQRQRRSRGPSENNKILDQHSAFIQVKKKNISEHDERKRQGQNNDRQNGSFRELYPTLSISDIII